MGGKEEGNTAGISIRGYTGDSGGAEKKKK